MTTPTTKLEFVNRDCGLVAEAELLGGTWYIEVRTDAPLNTIARDNEADVLEWALQHGFRRRRPPRYVVKSTSKEDYIGVDTTSKEDYIGDVYGA